MGDAGFFSEECFDTIVQLVHLRYLSINVLIETLPREIENLKNLETIVLKVGKYGYYVTFPETIWNMVNLKHIQVLNRNVRFSYDAKTFEECSELDGITVLSTLYIDDYVECEQIIRKLPNLEKLKWRAPKTSYWEDSRRERETQSLFHIQNILNNLKNCLVLDTLLFSLG